ncbi:uncharacterized protein LOC125858819 [Solanum stenotomum]|uniref:uncharacterized protein LOC125858819 n=1 Tax=Solanum stenotomum TaxID=172797 RepID=UPI0020D157C3|nr:uncharacterized protein LOC125858819 [Solanum stenotomum]
MNVVSKELMTGIAYALDSRRVWESLKEKVDKENSVGSFHLHKDIAFLAQGLNDSYSRAKSQILMMQPLPSLNQIYALVMQEKSQRSLTSVMSSLETTETNALMANKPASNPRSRKFDLFVIITKKPGHTRVVCRRLIAHTNNRN